MNEQYTSIRVKKSTVMKLNELKLTFRKKNPNTKITIDFLLSYLLKELNFEECKNE